MEEVVEDEDLAVAVGAGSDADGRDAGRGGDARCDLAWHSSEHDGDWRRRTPGWLRLPMSASMAGIDRPWTR